MPSMVAWTVDCLHLVLNGACYAGVFLLLGAALRLTRLASAGYNLDVIILGFVPVALFSQLSGPLGTRCLFLLGIPLLSLPIALKISQVALFKVALGDHQLTSGETVLLTFCLFQVYFELAAHLFGAEAFGSPTREIYLSRYPLVSNLQLHAAASLILVGIVARSLRQHTRIPALINLSSRHEHQALLFGYNVGRIRFYVFAVAVILSSIAHLVFFGVNRSIKLENEYQLFLMAFIVALFYNSRRLLLPAIVALILGLSRPLFVTVFPGRYAGLFLGGLFVSFASFHLLMNRYLVVTGRGER